jgi:aryl-alcohol dehydrogenase-like predicted oxidoreductase
VIIRRIQETQVSAIGLSGMPMSVEGRPDRDRSIRTIHAALDAGVTFIDTADAYHLGSDTVGHDETGHNEELVAEALHSRSGDAEILVATKGAHLRTADGTWLLDGRPRQRLPHVASASTPSGFTSTTGQIRRCPTGTPSARSWTSSMRA